MTANAPILGVSVGQKPAAGVIDIPTYIDQHPIGSFQIGITFICAAVLFIDGFDTQAIDPNLRSQTH